MRTDEQRQKHNEYMKNYRKDNASYSQYMKDYSKKYYEENKDKSLATSKEWVKKNPDKAKAIFNKSYEKNKLSGKRKELADKWRQENLANHRAYQRAYQSARKAKVRLVSVEEIDYDAIKLRCAGFCGICGEAILDKFEYDHIVPIARGGPHSTDNLQLAHMTCNRQKSAKLNFSLKKQN